jgi:hypothetical protein
MRCGEGRAVEGGGAGARPSVMLLFAIAPSVPVNPA